MSDIEKAFEMMAKYTTNNRDLIVFGIIIGLLSIGYISSSNPILMGGMGLKYIYASEINSTGFASTSENNVSCLNDINGCHWNGTESTTPWIVTIYFYNVTNFNYAEAMYKYNSTVGQSTHSVIREIWCTNENEFIALERFSNQDDWFYNAKSIPDDSHFIMSNKTVIVRYNHIPSGSSSHRFYIDTTRLVYRV